MIPRSFVQNASNDIHWQKLSQIEQDLIISRALIDLYNNEHIKNSFVFRGGTALNKLFLGHPSRYSEDIDLVQIRSEPIGQTIDIIREILTPWLGRAQWKITERSAKIIFRFITVEDLPYKLKVEINTTEHFQVLPIEKKDFSFNSDWFSGSASINTFHINELLATKLKAMYQRRKGRDLFDMWYVVKNQLVDLDEVVSLSKKYFAHDGLRCSSKEFLLSLKEKRDHSEYRSDMDALLPVGVDWSFEDAFSFVVENIVPKV